MQSPPTLPPPQNLKRALVICSGLIVKLWYRISSNKRPASNERPPKISDFKINAPLE